MLNFRPPWVYDCSRAPCGPCFCAISPHPLAGTWAHHLSGGAHLGVRWLESGVGTWGLPGSVGREHVPHCSSFSEACFLADADKEPGSSSSSDAEEDPLPANKCKKVSSSDAGLDSSMSAVALVLSGGSPTPSTPPQVDTPLLAYLHIPRLGLRADRKTQPVLALGSGLQPPSAPLSALTLLGLCLCRKSWLGLSSKLTSATCTRTGMVRRVSGPGSWGAGSRRNATQSSRKDFGVQPEPVPRSSE